jgi:FixJ family two-component response regulator
MIGAQRAVPAAMIRASASGVVGRGLLNKLIADRFGAANKTVKIHRKIGADAP